MSKQSCDLQTYFFSTKIRLKNTRHMKWINFTVVLFLIYSIFKVYKIFLGNMKKKLFCEIVLTHLANDHNWVKIIGTFAANMFFFSTKNQCIKKIMSNIFPKKNYYHLSLFCCVQRLLFNYISTMGRKAGWSNQPIHFESIARRKKKV